MSTRLRDKEEKIQQILERLATESTKGTTIIVEGRKDTETLRSMNVEGKIVSAKTGGKSLLDVISQVEKSKPHEVILMLDYDRRGKQLTSLIKRHLEAARIIVNTTFWGELFGLVGRDIKDIEGLKTYMETLSKKTRQHS